MIKKSLLKYRGRKGLRFLVLHTPAGRDAIGTAEAIGQGILQWHGNIGPDAFYRGGMPLVVCFMSHVVV